MGEIFLARQAIAGVSRLVVLKRLLPGLSEDPQLLAMFVDEARIAANLTHPGIVHVHEFGEDAEGFFIVMEYVAGHHVGQILARAQREGKPVPTRFGALIVHEVARALDHAHHARDSDGSPLEIVHRDISPSNVLVAFRGDVKLMDFGVARAANRAHRTNDGSIRGKLAYMAPEQIESKAVDARTDVYAAGILLWEITLGRRLFAGTTDFETIRAALEQPIARPRSIDPDYPAALDELVMAALERDRSRRLASAAELAQGLRSYLRTDPADRDDLAAWMAELYPEESAESERLEDETTQRDIAKPTVILQGDPVREPAAIDPLPITSPRRRWAALLIALLLIGSLAVIAIKLFHATEPPTDANPAAGSVPRTAPDTLVPSPDTADGVHEPLADAPTALAILPDAKPHRVMAAPPDSRIKVVVPADAPPIEHGAIRLISGEPGVAIHVEGPVACSVPTVPTNCPDLPAGRAYDFVFTIPGGSTFSARVRSGPGIRVYKVFPARGTVVCISGC